MPEFKLQRFRKGWAIAVYNDGQRISRRQLESRDAGSAAEEFRQLVAVSSRPQDPDVTAIWKLYVADKEGRAVIETMTHTGKTILATFGALKPDAITIKLCRTYSASRRAKGIQDGTIWTELGHLRMVLVWAQKTRLIDRTPAIERPAKPPPQDRHLTRQDVEQLVANASAPHVRLFVILALSTAARAGALFDLTWDRVDFQRGMIYLGPKLAVRPQKGRATVPMTATARAALSEAETGKRTSFVIEYAGEPVASVRTGLAAAAERAKVGKVTPHMLRHTAAVWMAEASVPMGQIAQFLGHRDANVTARVYARYSPEFLRSAASALELGLVRST